MGIDCGANYFLDFYFPEISFCLEIDGKQHITDNRQEHDAQRDENLKNHGYEVFRIEWFSINTEIGKQKMKIVIDDLLEIFIIKFESHQRVG